MSSENAEETVLKTSIKEEVMEGLLSWRNVNNGFKVIDLEFRADPAKRSDEWLIQSQAGMPRAQWNREYGKTWVVYDGKQVYQDYDDVSHTLTGNIIVGSKSKLISGWDAGPNDINLAWCLGVVMGNGTAVTIIDEYYVDDGDIADFVEVVSSRLQLEWAKLGGFSIHVADQSVFTQSGIASDAKKPGKAVADIMRQHGMNPIPGEISFTKRRQVVEKMLVTAFKWNNGSMVPRLRIHERCEFLREAMQGGYAFPRVASGVGGEYRPTPIKNKFSHLANAMEYLCSRLSAVSMSIPYENKPLPRRLATF